uniref:Dynein heavy chain 5, axonemal n=1 Tax=Cacopsylla melanoneura TaxID=428564 RepID=A0A8D8X2U6_9HEMI
MVEEAVEEVLDLVKKEAEIWKANNADSDTFFDTLLDETSSNVSKPSQAAIEPSGTPTQQQDWSSVYECFENPQNLLRTGGGLSKAMQEMVLNAVSEMRRYYSRKVIDVLIKVTRTSLDTLRRRFILNTGPPPVFLLDAKLKIPSVIIWPPLEEVQEALITAGKHITGVAKGVAQWNTG